MEIASWAIILYVLVMVVLFVGGILTSESNDKGGE